MLFEYRWKCAECSNAVSPKRIQQSKEGWALCHACLRGTERPSRFTCETCGSVCTFDPSQHRHVCKSGYTDTPCCTSEVSYSRGPRFMRFVSDKAFPYPTRKTESEYQKEQERVKKLSEEFKQSKRL